MTGSYAGRFPGVAAARRSGVTLADNGGGAQVPREALDAVARFLELENTQKGRASRRKIRVLEMIEAARAAFAELIGVAPETCGFGLNATTIAFSLARTIAHTIRPGDRIVVTDADHAANIVPWEWLARFGTRIDRVPVDARGELDEGAYAEALANEPVLVALPWASNGTGNVFDVARFAVAAKDAGALVIVDGVQAAPHLRMDVPEAVDALFFSAYKIYAPHFGAWYARPEFAQRFFTADDPLLPSEPWHWSMETGTQNHEGLAGWLGTIAYMRDLGNGDVRAAMDRIAAHEAEIARYALGKFAERADHVTLYGRTAVEDRLPVFAFNIRGETPEGVAQHLDTHGIEANAGNFYSPRLMRTVVPASGAAVRFSYAHYTDIADVDQCFTALDALIGATV